MPTVLKLRSPANWQTAVPLRSTGTGKSRTSLKTWAKGTLDWRRAVVTSFLDGVLIMPTRRKGRVPFDV
ncbi:MAG: hypothetical protein ABIQ47_09580, partial [Tepidiformaceae bacterium]